MDNTRLELRVLKYEDYIRKNPEKAYGYYCAGKLTMLRYGYRDAGVAEKYFKRALSISSEYTPAAISLIEYLAVRGKLVAAVKLYKEYRHRISGKHIYSARLVKTISSLYEKGLFPVDPPTIFSKLTYMYDLHLVGNLYKKDRTDIFVNLLLCLHSLPRGLADDRAIAVFNTCVGLQSLDDGMRWALVKSLSVHISSIMHDRELAYEFNNIPCENFSPEYANIIFEIALETKSLKKVKVLIETAEKFNIALTPHNLWKYVYRCTESGLYDNLVYKCCKRLLKEGWVDKVVADALSNLRRLQVVENLKQEEKVLSLFGYSL